MVVTPSNQAICVLLERFLGTHKRIYSSSVDTQIVNTKPTGLCALIGDDEKLELTSSCHIDTEVEYSVSDSSINFCPMPLSLRKQISALLYPSKASHVIVTTYNKRVGDTMRAFRDYVLELRIACLDHFGASLAEVSYNDINKFTKHNCVQLSTCFQELTSALYNILDVFYGYSPDVFMQLADTPFYTQFYEIDQNIQNYLKKLQEMCEQCWSDSDLHKTLMMYKVQLIIHYLDKAACCFLDFGKKLLENVENATLLPSDCLQNADIVFCTLATASGAVQKHIGKIDVLIVDEAAQSSEGELIATFGCNPDYLVLVGDQKQLGPLIYSDFIKHIGIGGSAMDRLITRCKHKHYFLDTQYRMHPNISQFPNAQFYGEIKILNAPAIETRPDPCAKIFEGLIVHRYHTELTSPVISCGSKRKQSSRAKVEDFSAVLKNIGFIDIATSEEEPCSTSYCNRKEANFIVR